MAAEDTPAKPKRRGRKSYRESLEPEISRLREALSSENPEDRLYDVLVEMEAEGYYDNQLFDALWFLVEDFERDNLVEEYQIVRGASGVVTSNWETEYWADGKVQIANATLKQKVRDIHEQKLNVRWPWLPGRPGVTSTTQQQESL